MYAAAKWIERKTRRHTAKRIPPPRHTGIGKVSLLHGKCDNYL